jgi:hypothetical protein
MQRGADYRERGWQGYDPSAPAFGADEIAQERDRYRVESRSFQSTGMGTGNLGARPMGDSERDGDLNAPSPGLGNPTQRNF